MALSKLVLLSCLLVLCWMCFRKITSVDRNEPPPLAVIPWLEYGLPTDGIGLKIPGRVISKSNPKFPNSVNGYLLVCLGECSECSRLRTETMPAKDGVGRPIIMMTSSTKAFQQIQNELHKWAILDVNGKLSKALKGVISGRQYVLSQGFVVIRAQTGNPNEDIKDGFSRL